MSGQTMQGGDPLVQQIYDWDDYVEDHAREQASRPFDAGIMLAVARLLDMWSISGPEGIADAVKGLRETAETIVEDGFLDEKENPE